jgi:hypothetical protein
MEGRIKPSPVLSVLIGVGSRRRSASQAIDLPSNGGVNLGRFVTIQRNVLRVSCRRCARIVEIQKADAVRLYGQDAIWREVGQRLLDNTCQQRTGRHEEDGCWPSFE